MKYIKTVLVASLVAGLSTTLFGSQIRLESNNTAAALDASGASLSTFAAGTFTFQVGSFGSGFTPSFANVDQWTENWTFSGLASSWNVSGPFANRVRNQINVDTNTSGLVGQQGFVWGFNSSDVGAESQWVLITNENWVFPAYSGLELPADIKSENIWNLNSAGNMVLVGSFVGGDATGGFQMQAIPEPSTYALIFGLGALGFLGYRRMRK